MKPDKVIKRLRWVMVCVIFFDFANTLLGQPGTYWQHPETVNEHNPLFHALLAHSWLLFVLFNLFYLAGGRGISCGFVRAQTTGVGCPVFVDLLSFLRRLDVAGPALGFRQRRADCLWRVAGDNAGSARISKNSK